MGDFSTSRRSIEFISTLASGKPVVVTATILPEDPSVGDPETYEDFYVYSAYGNRELFLEPEEEEALVKEMWSLVNAQRI